MTTIILMLTISVLCGALAVWVGYFVHETVRLKWWGKGLASVGVSLVFGGIAFARAMQPTERVIVVQGEPCVVVVYAKEPSPEYGAKVYEEVQSRYANLYRKSVNAVRTAVPNADASLDVPVQFGRGTRPTPVPEGEL